MAYQEHGMQEIFEVLRRAHLGHAKATIARVTGRGRRTVRRWIEVAVELGWTPSSAPDEALAVAVLERCRPGRPSEPGETSELLEARREQLVKWLRPSEANERGLRLKKVHELLARSGVHVPYSSLHRYAVAELGFGDKRRVTVRVADTAPGEVAEVDFGKLGVVADPASGKRRAAWALIVTLVHSRHQYVHVTWTQTLADLVDGLEAAWAFFDGVPARVILDNMKAAITKPDRYDPFFQRTFEEYARHRGFEIDAAVVRDPTGKPHVERGVQYLRESFFRGEQWIDLAHVQRDAIRWCTEVAGKRIHGTTRLQPLEVFETIERAALRPLTGDRFDTPQWARCKVHGDHHVIFGKALYSVPTKWTGTEVEIRGDRGLVRIYARGVLVKTHPREQPGGRSTDYDDYPKELVPYAMRDPQRMIADASVVGPSVGRFMRELLAGAFPWAKLRQAQKLLRLAARHGRDTLDRACARALAFSLVDVQRVERIVLQGLDRVGLPSEPGRQGEVVPMPPRFLRPPESFTRNNDANTNTNTSKDDNNDGDQTVTHHRAQTAPSVGHPPDASRSSRARSQDQDD